MSSSEPHAPAFTQTSTEQAQEAYMDRLIDAVFMSGCPVTAADAVHALTTILACVTVAERIPPTNVVLLYHKHLRVAATTPME
jgi:hypothetical protein